MSLKTKPHANEIFISNFQKKESFWGVKSERCRNCHKVLKD